MDLAAAVATSRPLIFQGAYDPNIELFRSIAETGLQREYPRGAREWNLVRDTHRTYIDSGCDVLQTLTWGLHGASGCSPAESDKIIGAARRDAEVAREVAEGSTGRRVWVAGVVPAGMPSWDAGGWDPTQAANQAAFVAQGLIAGGADFLLAALPTGTGDARALYEGGQRALQYQNSETPIVVSFEIQPAGAPRSAGLLSGEDLGQALATLQECGAFSAGVYLTTHPSKLPEDAFQRQRGAAPLHVFTDAGHAEFHDGEVRRTLGPTEYAEIVLDQAQRLGLCFVGGGWGVSPQHIRALRDAVDAADWTL